MAISAAAAADGGSLAESSSQQDVADVRAADGGREAIPSKPRAERIFLKDLSFTQLEHLVVSELGEEPKRARQLWTWLYRDRFWAEGPQQMEGVSRAFRSKLADAAHFDSLRFVSMQTARDGTRKIRFELLDESLRFGGRGSIIETVVIPHSREVQAAASSSGGEEEEECEQIDDDVGVDDDETIIDGDDVGGRREYENENGSEEDCCGPKGASIEAREQSIRTRAHLRSEAAAITMTRSQKRKIKMREQEAANKAANKAVKKYERRNTVCVSSQVGCAMGCQFCFTAKMGLHRHLSVGQMVDQVVQVRRMLTHEIGPITNVVFMGMGEPLHNLSNVLPAVDTLLDVSGLHCSASRTTVSTSGLVPEIKEFCRRSSASLAVSLNATTDEVRDVIMPVNKRYDIATLISCLKEVFPRSKQQDQVFLEYVMLQGVNDSFADAERLLSLTDGLPCKINLITFNPHQGTIFQPSPLESVFEFQDYLVKRGRKVFVRRSRGDDEMAACGQLGEPRKRLNQAVLT